MNVEWSKLVKKLYLRVKFYSVAILVSMQTWSVTSNRLQITVTVTDYIVIVIVTDYIFEKVIVM